MEPFIGEILMFGGNFAPRGWALCDGSLLSISQFQALFSILGTTYGGDGRTTFALPDLRGRAPVHPGSGPGLTPRQLGEKSGAESVALSEAQMPSHSHTVNCSNKRGTTNLPEGNLMAHDPDKPYGPTAAAHMAPNMISASGSGQAHDNMQPYLAVNFIIALQGTYPSRN